MLTSVALLAAALPFSQAWSDTGLIARDDDWSGVAAVVGYRGDGLTSTAGTDPRTVSPRDRARLWTSMRTRGTRDRSPWRPAWRSSNCPTLWWRFRDLPRPRHHTWSCRSTRGIGRA